MSSSSSTPSSLQNALQGRVSAIAQDLCSREERHQEEMQRAWQEARRIQSDVAAAILSFNGVVRESLPEFQVNVSEPRLDDKHLHAVEFNLTRGRHRAIVTAKSKGEVTLVGPFREGKNEGPCRSFSFDAESDLEDAVVDFVERFLEDAAAP